MPQAPIETNNPISLCITLEEKSLLMHATALEHTNLAEFIIRNAMSAAREVIDENERLKLSERDSQLVLDLLDNPPTSNEKLMAAAFSLPSVRHHQT